MYNLWKNVVISDWFLFEREISSRISYNLATIYLSMNLFFVPNNSICNGFGNVKMSNNIRYWSPPFTHPTQNLSFLNQIQSCSRLSIHDDRTQFRLSEREYEWMRDWLSARLGKWGTETEWMRDWVSEWEKTLFVAWLNHSLSSLRILHIVSHFNAEIFHLGNSHITDFFPVQNIA